MVKYRSRNMHLFTVCPIGSLLKLFFPGRQVDRQQRCSLKEMTRKEKGDLNKKARGALTVNSRVMFSL